jgi:ligand-binding SRPBCC domain-containing protein
MAAHTLKSVQRIPATIEEVWHFFSDPQNLQRITPAHMKFKVVSQHHGDALYAGQIFEYEVSPVLGIPLYWMTEITHVQRPYYFVDEQRKGPYSFWQHQHHFREIEGGVEMTDIVHYRNPLGFFGELANLLFVRKKVRSIFSYRFAKVEEVFGVWKGPGKGFERLED